MYENVWTTLSNTPSFSDKQIATIKEAAKQMMISEQIFDKKKESRFKFAHSVDPLTAKP